MLDTRCWMLDSADRTHVATRLPGQTCGTGVPPARAGGTPETHL